MLGIRLRVSHNKNYKSYAVQHGSRGEDYLIASSTETKAFFDGVIARRNTLYCYIQIEGDELSFVLSPAIVEFIGENMFRQDDELEAAKIEVDDVSPALAAETATKIRRNAMKLFIVPEDRTYNVTIKNVMRFTLAVDYVSIEMSFRQTAAAIEHAKIRTKTANLSGINDHMVGQFIRVLVAIPCRNWPTFTLLTTYGRFPLRWTEARIEAPRSLTFARASAGEAFPIISI
jgi:hypothetical protein